MHTRSSKEPSALIHRRTAMNALLAALLAGAGTLSAQTSANLPTRGKEFWLGFMQNAYGAQELRLQIAATAATSGTVSMPLTGWSQNFTVAANAVTFVTVPNTAEHMGSEVVTNKGVLVQALDSVTVTAVSFQSFTHDAAQVLPLQGLGTSYRAEAYRGLPGFSEFYKSEILIVATADATQVEITPTVQTSGGHAAGVPFVVNLNAGQTYQVQGQMSAYDLTGTLVQATAANGPCRPFAVFGGSMCANVPVACPACDHLFEQMPPISAWGTEFLAALPAPATSYTYRITAAQNGTSVTVNGAAPTVLNAGQSLQVAGCTQAVCISATLPVSVVQIMEGYNCAGAGDPSMIVLTPTDRKTKRATWKAQNSTQVNNHRVMVIIPGGTASQMTLDAVAVNAASFTPFPGCAAYSWALLPVTAATHTLASQAGFIAYAYGTGTGESYAYPLGNNAPPVAVQPDPIVCATGPVTLTAPVPLTNAWWDVQSAPGNVIATGPSYTFTPPAADVYTVHGELSGSGCTQQFTWTVGVPVDPSTQITANGLPGTSACMFAPVQLNTTPPPSTAFYQIDWSPAALLSDAHIPDPVAYPTQNTWFVLHITSPAGCGSFLDSVFVSVMPGDVYAVHASASDTDICLGETTQLQAKVERVVAYDLFDGALGSMWTSVQGGSINNVCGTVTGGALYFNGAAPRIARTAALNVSTGGYVHFALKIADGTAPCEDADPGEDVVLEYSVNGGSNWIVLATYNESAYPSFTSIDVPLPAGALTASTLFRWRQPTFTAAGQDNWVLDNVVITKVNGTGLSYSWSPPAVCANPGGASTAATPTATGSMAVTVTDPNNGCNWTDAVSITVAPAFSISSIQDTTVCNAGQTIQLTTTASSGSGIQWQWTPNNGTLSSTTTASPLATINANTNYQVTATTSNGCSATDQIAITLGGLSGLSVNATQSSLCAGAGTTLNAVASGAGSFTYAWSPASSLNNGAIASPTATPASTTTYSCLVTEPATGCARTASTVVTVHGPYSVVAPPDATVCSALGLPLNVQHNVPAPFTISWTPAANLNSGSIASPTILADVSATYIVVVTDAFGCSATDSTQILVPFASLIPSTTLNGCQGQTIQLDAGFPGNTYAWSNGATTQQISVSTSGPFTVTITDALGCQGIRTFQVNLAALPPVNLGPDLSLCGAATQVLNANSPGNTAVWNTGANGQQITVSTTNDYSVIVTGPQGCQSFDTVHVAFNAMPVDNLQDITTCVSSPPVLDAGNAGCSYSWNTGATTQTIAPGASGTFTVSVTTPQNCNAVFDAVVNLMPLVSVDLGPDTTICQGTSLTLDAGQGPGYSWNTGATSQTINVTSAGTYSVAVTNGSCNASDAITVAVQPTPVDVLSDVTHCVDAPIVLDAGNAGCTYLWSNGATSQSISVPATGNYSVNVTNGLGCTATFDAVATYVPYPVVDIGPDTVLCEGDVLLLDAGNPGSTYVWNTGALTRTIQVTGNGLYTVAVDNGYCTTVDSLKAMFNPLPSKLTSHQYYTCLDEDPHYVVIDAGNPGDQFSWSNGSVSQVILAGAYGWYYVEVTNTFDCAVRDSAHVIEYCPASIYVPNSFTPNGDGLNDVWMPVGKNIGSLELYVFDRWGNVLFETDRPDRGWDGTAAGKLVQNDVYVWRMRYRFIDEKDGALGPDHEQLGHVTVVY